MTYYIDQSGKIEDSHRLTVVAVANGITKTIIINASEKQKLLTSMRVLDYPQKLYIYKIFAGLIYLLLKDITAQQIIIDEEYPGHEVTIKNYLLNLYQNQRQSCPTIDFSNIGKNSPAHKSAILTFRKKIKPDIIVKAKHILKLFYV